MDLVNKIMSMDSPNNCANWPWSVLLELFSSQIFLEFCFYDMHPYLFLWFLWLCSGLNIVPQNPVYPEAQNVTIFGNRIFEDVIKMRPDWIRVGPIFKDWWSYKLRWRHRHTEKRMACEEAEIGGMHLKPRNTKDCRRYPKARIEALERFSPKACKRNQPWRWLDFILLASWIMKI